jgi:hypothetical protein
MPHCPKMAAMMENVPDTVPNAVGALNLTSTCCRVVPGRPQPASQSVVPAHYSSTVVASLQVAVAVTVLPIAVRSDSPPSPPLAPSQAVLCTFLI